jgi:hypothetical protein
MSAASSPELVTASLLAGSRPGPTESSRREPGWSLSRLPTLSGFPHLVALAASSGKPAARAYRFASCAAPGSPPRRAPSLGRPSPPAGARQERVSVNTSSLLRSRLAVAGPACLPSWSSPALRSLACAAGSAVLVWRSPLRPSRFPAGPWGLPLAAGPPAPEGVGFILPWASALLQGLTEPPCCPSRPCGLGQRLPWGLLPLRAHQRRQSTVHGFASPASFRLQVLVNLLAACSCPRLATSILLKPRARPGFALQGFLASPCSRTASRRPLPPRRSSQLPCRLRGARRRDADLGALIRTASRYALPGRGRSERPIPSWAFAPLGFSLSLPGGGTHVRRILP